MNTNIIDKDVLKLALRLVTSIENETQPEPVTTNGVISEKDIAIELNENENENEALKLALLLVKKISEKDEKPIEDKQGEIEREVLDRLRFETGQSPVLKSSLGQSSEEFNRDRAPFEFFNWDKQ